MPRLSLWSRYIANGDGPWGNFLHIRIARVSAFDFDIEVGTRNSIGTFYSLEAYEKVSLDSTLNTYAETMINDISPYITVAVTGVTLPALTNDDDGVALENGAQTLPTVSDYASFYQATPIKIHNVSIIVLPGQSWAVDGSGNAVISETLAHCEKMKNRVLIIDAPETVELSNAGEIATMALPTSSYSVLYYPWVGVSNPVYHPDRNPSVSSTINIAPSAIAAGMWAKFDAERGVWKAPAGVRAQLNGVSSLKFQVGNLEQDKLNPLGVNCIRKMPNFGLVFWGARTLAATDPEWRYIPVRRTAIFIEQSIYEGIQWTVFEPNDHRLWSALRGNIGNFMNGLFRDGAFQGEKASDAYFVRCGLGDTMTQGDIDTGQVIVIVGFAPLKPAEFVIVRIEQKVTKQ